MNNNYQLQGENEKKIIKFKLLIINNNYIDQFPKIIVATSSISMLVDDPYSMPTFQGAE